MDDNTIDRQSGIFLYRNIRNRLNGITQFRNEIGVKHVIDNYEQHHNGKHLYDLFFKNIYNIKNTNTSNLSQVFDHGTTKENVRNTVTAGIPGPHIYVTENKNIVGIVIRIIPKLIL
jgi:hypothetical protein